MDPIRVPQIPRIYNTTTFTSTVTPTCYTTNVLVLGRVCQATKTILGRRRRDASLIEDGPIVEMQPIVEMDGKTVDYERLIRPHRVSKSAVKQRNAGCFFFGMRLFIQGPSPSCIGDKVVRNSFLCVFVILSILNYVQTGWGWICSHVP